MTTVEEEVKDSVTQLKQLQEERDELLLRVKRYEEERRTNPTTGHFLKVSEGLRAELIAENQELKEEQMKLISTMQLLTAGVGNEISLVQEANEKGLPGRTIREVLNNAVAIIRRSQQLQVVNTASAVELLKGQQQYDDVLESIKNATLHMLQAREDRYPVPTLMVAGIVAAAIGYAYCPEEGHYRNGHTRDIFLGCLRAAVVELTGLDPTGRYCSSEELEDLLDDVIQRQIDQEDVILEHARLFRYLRDASKMDNFTPGNSWMRLGYKKGEEFDELVRRMTTMEPLGR